MTDFVQPPLVMERAIHKHECPMCHGYLRDRGGVYTCDWCGFEPEFEQRIAAMQRLGASLQELAEETRESIMGYNGKGGHKPPRPDIQKMKEVHDRYIWKQNFNQDNPYGWESYEDADRDWDEKYTLSNEEKLVVQSYCNFYRVYHQPERAFQATIGALLENKAGMPFFAIDPDDNPSDALKAAKKMLGAALKKYEQQNWGELYAQIQNSLDDVYRRGPLESYKLWPRMVAWLKEAYQQALFASPNAVNRPDSFTFQSTAKHIEDITTEGGKILDQLRRENRLPQGFDVNKISFQDFEQWLMEWKRENLGAENAGEVVYQFHDGWTIQKLKTPEQLQFEGDEMGHCVGGYAHAVGDGQTIIYSLRDPKGMPHVTMEMHALEGAPSYGFGGEEPPEDAIFNHEYIHPDQHDPGEHMEDTRDGYKSSGETPFEVVQVMGNSNKTPKPEYQRKIREFLDYLRSKGWKFERSDDWFAPFDDPAQNEYGDGAPGTARELDEWYDDHYKTHHEAYRGVGEGDAYGLPAERATIGIGDWEELFKDIFGSLVEEYDPGRWRGNWRDLAQAVFHAWFIDIYKDHLDAAGLKRHKENLVSEIENAEQTLHEWNDNNWDYAQEHVQDEIAEEIKQEAQKRGELEKIEAALDEEYGEDMWDDRELLEWVRENDDDLYYHGTDKARDEVTDSYAGDAYKFCNYLIQLAEKFGGVNPQDLPNPNDRHGGLPSYEELQEMPWKSEAELDEQNVHPLKLPGALSHWVEANVPIEIHPIDHEHNVWFDTDGNQRARFRPGWAKNPTTGKMEQTGELEDTFLDKQGRQGQGWVAYHGDEPVGSLTYVDDPSGWHMIGTTFVHPNYREQGLFNRLVAPLRETGRPIDAYVWENPWLKNKVRSWR